MLKVLKELPDEILDCEAGDLYDALGGPALFHLPGRREQPLFVSLLLHGNEDTGWIAMRELLERHWNQGLPRALSVFIGNVEAAKFDQRYLPHQPDYNRIWKKTGKREMTPEHEMMQQIIADMKQRKPYASIDVHNNTGFNPHYGCVNKLDHRFLHLATLFSRTVVYFTRPDTVQSRAFSSICPAVTVECGQPGQPNGVAHALDFLDACLHMHELPGHAVSPHDIDLFHTKAIVKVPKEISFGFGETNCDLKFIDNLDHLNFRELPAGTTLAQVHAGKPKLDVRDENGRDVGARFFKIENGELKTKVPVMPSMLTGKPEAIRQDCLCYLMERVPGLPD